MYTAQKLRHLVFKPLDSEFVFYHQHYLTDYSICWLQAFLCSTEPCSYTQSGKHYDRTVIDRRKV